MTRTNCCPPTSGIRAVHDLFQSSNKSRSDSRPESVASRPFRSDSELHPVHDRHGLLSLEIKISNYLSSQLYRIVPRMKNVQTMENVKSLITKVFVNVQKIILALFVK